MHFREHPRPDLNHLSRCPQVNTMNVT